jgi:hypothetical protein
VGMRAWRNGDVFIIRILTLHGNLAVKMGMGGATLMVA